MKNKKIKDDDALNESKEIKLNDVLNEAKKYCISLGHQYIGTEHFMYVMLRDFKILQTYLKYTSTEFDAAIRDKIGVSTTNEDFMLNTPLLTKVLTNVWYGGNPYDALFNLLFIVSEGIAYRILIEECVLEPLKLVLISDYLSDEFKHSTYYKNLCLDEDDEEDDYDEDDYDEDDYEDSDAINDCKEYSKNDIDICKEYSKKQALPSYCTILNDIDYKCNPSIGQDKIIELIEKTLLKLNKPNVLLIGEPGVGKTALVEGIAYRIQQGLCNDLVKDFKIISCSTSSLVAGTKYRGEFEEKIEKLVKLISADKNNILFLDEMHTTVKAGGSDGAISMANILKPYLARGDIKVIGATTKDELNVIEQDKAYNRRFTKIEIIEPNVNKTKEILFGSIPKFSSYYKIDIDKTLTDYIVDNGTKIKGVMPDNCLDILENACVETIYNKNKKLTKETIDYIIENTEHI